MAIKKVASMLGLSEDMDLPELVELANDHLDLNLTVDEQPATAAVAQVEILELAAQVDAALNSGGPGVKLYRVRAKPEGKPAITALVLLGGCGKDL